MIKRIVMPGDGRCEDRLAHSRLWKLQRRAAVRGVYFGCRTLVLQTLVACCLCAAAGPAAGPVCTAKYPERLSQAREPLVFKNKRGWGNKEELHKRRGWVPYANQTKYTDSEMGLTEYVGRRQEGLDGGVFKWFWGDFRVQEVAREGHVVCLTDVESLPELPWPEEDGEDDVIFDVEQLLGPEAGRALQVLVRNARRKPEAIADIVVDSMTAGLSAQRILTRRRTRLEADLLNKTLENETSAYILRCSIRARSATAPRADRRHLRFTLAKCGWDTISCAKEIGRVLGVPDARIGYAGVKDKAAITEQLISCQGVSPRRVLALNSRDDTAGFRVGNLKYSTSTGEGCEGLEVGEHGGNAFTILLRHVTTKAHQARKALRAVGKSGFVNYFGHQRFGDGGGSGLASIEVGRALAQRDWRHVVRAALNSSRVCSRSELIAKRLFEKGDLRGAAQSMPSACLDERALLLALADGLNEAEACRQLPHRTMFMCAYWSWLWNAAASARVRQHGAARAVAGDLVVVGGDPSSRTPTRGDEGILAGKRVATKMVTRGEEEAGVYSVFDVCIPVSGALIFI